MPSDNRCPPVHSCCKKMFRICCKHVGIILNSSVNSRHITSSAVHRAAKSDKERFDEPASENQALVKINRRYQGLDQTKNKDEFLALIDHMSDDINTKRRQNHVDIIYVALKSLKSVRLDKDLEVYKKILNILPKGKMIPRNIIQAEFQHYPKQQQCAIDLLEQMEDNSVIPDPEMEKMLLNIFGKRGYPLRKYWRMMYWMPKFKNSSPFPLDNEFLRKFPGNADYRSGVQDDSQEDEYLNQLAMLTLKRIAAVDVTVEFYQKFNRVTYSLAPNQIEMFNGFATDKWCFAVEGPFHTWYHHHLVEYFVLKGTSLEKGAQDEGIPDDDDVDKIEVPGPFGDATKTPPSSNRGALSSVHNQVDGTIFSVCIVALQGEVKVSDPSIDFQAGKVSLVREWVAALEEEHGMKVAEKNLIFRLRFEEEEQPKSEDERLAEETRQIRE